MATNDFLPFAVGGSANVLTQAQYAALAALTTGFQSGVADSKSVNKAWRQSSIMAAVLAQFIVNQTGQNATDDGTTATLIANLLAAVKASSNAVVGTARNVSMSVAAASASGTLTADEIIVETALGGLTYRLASVNKTINLATAGAGGMDTSSAPASSFVGIYAIYNPTTGASALLGVSANGVKLPEVYGGANMPAGYTASALLTVVPTNASSLISPCVVMDRSVDIASSGLLSTSAVAASPTIINNLAVPINAKTCSGFMQIGSSAAASVSFSLCSSAAGTNQQVIALTLNASGSIAAPFNKLKLTVGQRAYYLGSSSAGTPTFSAQVSSYDI